MMATYVALGSSYASGPGVAPIVDAGCGRSGNNYPSLLARELGADLVDASCAGATVEDVLSRRQVLLTGGSVRPQVQAVGPDADLVTITVGGNDIGYVSTLMRCSYRVSPQGVPADAVAFFSAPVDLAAAQAGLVELPQRLAELVTASAASRGHGVCSPDPWVTGWQFGDPRTGGVVPYHPNAAGMRAVADLVAGALRS